MLPRKLEIEFLTFKRPE